MDMNSGEDSTVIRARGLTKVFKDFWRRPKAKAVNEIDFDVNRGEIIGLLGPNGSGKSTTIKMILGLLYPSSGSLSVLGRSPTSVKAKARIGYLPEESYLYKYLTAYETLDFFASLFNLDKTSRDRRCRQLLEMVGLAHVRGRQVGEFSKGMARRIGLAQAMINDPDLLILDEPTSGLDPLGCKEVKDLIKFLRGRGKTILISSHLLGDVEDICDRVMILYGGRIRATGSLSSLLTVNNSTTLTAPALDPDTLAKVLALLRGKFAEDQFRVSKERMSLEDFFIDVVQEARASSEQTSGVSGGGGIAEYLTEGQVASVLPEILREREAVAPPPVAEPRKSVPLPEILREPAAPVAEERVDADKVLAERLRKADGKLDDLLPR